LREPEGKENVVEGFPRGRARLLRVSPRKINRIAALLLKMTTEHDDMTLIRTECCAFGLFGD